MKLKTTLSHRFNSTILTSVGHISTNEKGEFDLDKDKAVELLLIDPTYEALEKEPKSPKGGGEEITGEILSLEGDENEVELEMIKLLKKSTVAELKEMCKTAHLPDIEWNTLTKDPLTIYVAQHLKDKS